MTRWSMKALLFGAAIWFVVLVVGLVRGNAIQIVAGAVLAGLFGVLSVARYLHRPR